VTIDVVMAARNESATISANIAAAKGCRFARDVIVVDDGSEDGTADVADAAGAQVVRRERGGSKALAMAAGVAATDAEAILFVDADCVGLTSDHLDAICAPFAEGRADMSLGFFDYGAVLNPLVRRLPPITGERVVHRWIWEAIAPEKLEGYTIELRINEVVAERRLRTIGRTMRGVSHRTKREKHGIIEGFRRTWWMYRELLSMLRPFGDLRWRAYGWYLRGLTVERAH
jgi:glycosyltransferase involved in cell wall biosynthesis